MKPFGASIGFPLGLFRAPVDPWVSSHLGLPWILTGAGILPLPLGLWGSPLGRFLGLSLGLPCAFTGVVFLFEVQND